MKISKAKKYQMAIDALKYISASGGNMPDSSYDTKCGPNEGNNRGIILIGMRNIAIEALNKMEIPLPIEIRKD